MEETIRVLIADDHTLFREGLAALLNSVSGLEVVATVEDGQRAIEFAAQLQPARKVA